jgi:hypothetical protein
MVSKSKVSFRNLKIKRNVKIQKQIRSDSMEGNTNMVMKGKWTDCFHSHTKTYEIAIIKSDRVYGSGDDRDPLEIYKGFPMTCYYLLFIEEVGGNIISTRSENHYQTVEEAVKEAEKMTKQRIRWNGSGEKNMDE